MEINTINNNIDNLENNENNESTENNDLNKTELKKCPICNKMVSNLKRHQKSKACSNFVKIIDHNNISNISNNNILNYIKLIEDEIISLEIDNEIKKNIQNNLNLITDNVKLLKNKSFSIIQNMCDIYNI